MRKKENSRGGANRPSSGNGNKKFSRDKRDEGGKSFGKGRDKKSFSNDEDNSERRSFGSGRQGGKSFSKEKPKRSFDGGSKSGKKSFGAGRSTGRDFPGGKEKRSFGDDDSKRERRSFDEERPARKSFSKETERRSFGDSNKGERKSFGDSDNKRKKRSFDAGRSSGRDFSRDKEERSFGTGDERKERRSFSGSDGRKDSRYGAGSGSRGRGREREEDVENEYSYTEKKRTSRDSGKKNPRKKSAEQEEGLIRLNRYIANAGICSRREADELIRTGVISVNGKVVTEMGYKVKPGDIVKYSGETLRRERMVYVLLNKPKDYITTLDDPGGRKTVLELVEDAAKERLYPVGRLDRSTTGVLLLTNDGELTKRLTHPRYGVKKTYHVTLDKGVKSSDLQKIMEGFELEDGMIKADDVAYVGDGQDKSQVGIELHSGRNRIVRRIFEHLGYRVEKLDRVSFAGLTKKDLPRGRWRHLTEREVGMLYMISSKA